jgi:hypothetical protein
VAIDTPALQIASYNSPLSSSKPLHKKVEMDHHPFPPILSALLVLQFSRIRPTEGYHKRKKLSQHYQSSHDKKCVHMQNLIPNHL